jgi:hypothetical protein
LCINGDKVCTVGWGDGPDIIVTFEGCSDEWDGAWLAEVGASDGLKLCPTVGTDELLFSIDGISVLRVVEGCGVGGWVEKGDEVCVSDGFVIGCAVVDFVTKHQSVSLL